MLVLFFNFIISKKSERACSFFSTGIRNMYLFFKKKEIWHQICISEYFFLDKKKKGKLIQGLLTRRSTKKKKKKYKRGHDTKNEEMIPTFI